MPWGISNTRFNLCAQVIEARFSAGVWLAEWIFLRLRRLAGVTRARYLLLGAPKVGALGEHTVKTGKVYSWFWHQGDQPGYGRLYGPPPFVKTPIYCISN